MLRLTGSLRSLRRISIPRNTVMVFHQSAAPLGWTKDVASTLNNAAMRVVTSTAWASGKAGATAFDSVFGASKATVSYALVEADLPAHTHGLGSLAIGGESAHTHPQQRWTGGSAGGLEFNVAGENFTPATTDMPSTAAGTSHSHGVSGALANAGSDNAHSHNLSLDLNYINLIIASKD